MDQNRISDTSSIYENLFVQRTTSSVRGLFYLEHFPQKRADSGKCVGEVGGEECDMPVTEVKKAEN